LFGSRFLLGIGEAPTFPGNAKAVGYWFPKQERTLATAMFDSMAKFSSAIGVPLLGLVLLHFGWRANFALTGLISLVYFALFYTYYKNPSQDLKLSAVEREHIQRGGAQPEDAVRAAAGAPLGYLIAQPKVIGLALGYGSYNYVFYLLLTWLPTYLHDAHHLDLAQSVFYTAIPWLSATVAELTVGGWLVDALIQHGWNAVRVRQTVLVWGMSLGLGIFGVAYSETTRAAVFWIAVSITGLSVAAPVGARKCWHGRRHHEPQQSDCGNCRANRDRLYRCRNAFVFSCILGRRVLLGDRYRRLHLPPRQHGAHPRTARCGLRGFT
jgi:MFS transporter, ACS family, D-galactonate transporter